MKKSIASILCAILLMSAVGCGINLELVKVQPPTVVEGADQLQQVTQSGQQPVTPNPEPDNQQTETPVEPLDLTGSWKQVDGNSGENYQFAIIEDGAISIYWALDDGTTALYWAGSYTAPTEPGDSYTWDSVNDTNRTAAAILASSADSKPFSYEGGRLKYEVSAMGTSTTVQLEPFDGELPQIPEAPAPSAGRQENEGILGQYYVKVTGFRMGKDYGDNDVLVLQYDFSNNSEAAVAADVAIIFIAYQDGVQIETSFGGDVNDDDSKSIKPGITISCEQAFTVTGKSPVEIEITEFMSFNDEVVTTTYNFVQ